jgi:hypothetical protein
MNKKIILKILIIFTFIQCNAQVSNSVKPENNNLIIKGDKIWIREYPSTGDVIFELNNGDICKVLKKDKKEVINQISDFWYKIEYKGKIGWVFGSQTSIKQGSIELSIKVDKERVFIKPFDDINIKYEKGLNIKIIDKVLVNDEEFDSRILFEYTYSEKEPPLTFINVFVAGEPYGIYVLNKTMDFYELQKKVNDLHLSIFSSEELDPTNILLTKEGIFVDVNYYTTMNSTVIYNQDNNGFITKTKQNEYFINKKTIALENFDFFESKGLKNIKGNISKDENLTIISTIEDNFSTGGIFKIKSEKGEIGWIRMRLIPGFGNENKPQLKEIRTSVW